PRRCATSPAPRPRSGASSSAKPTSARTDREGRSGMNKATSLAAGVALAIAAFAASAQDAARYPSKPVRLIVGFTPGAATDITARIIAQKFSEAWGVAVTVDNVPGAGGTVGALRAAKSPPDGYTLQYGANGAMTIAPGLYTNLPYDPSRDFAPVSELLTMCS